MSGFNRVQILGNLGSDPELRVTQGGSSVLNLSIAANETFLGKDGKKQERTEWVKAVLWGTRGENIAKFLKKGDRIFIEGSLRTDSYEKDGKKHYSTKVTVREVVLLGNRQEGGESRRPSSSSRSSKKEKEEPKEEQEPTPDDIFGDDEIPF